MFSPAIITILAGTIILALYFIVKAFCKPKETFDSKPKVMLFKAEWCGHCKKFMPVWDEVSKSLGGEAEFIKYDSEEHKDTMSEYGVKGFPTVYKVVDGEKTNFEGPRTVDALTEFVRSG